MSTEPAESFRYIKGLESWEIQATIELCQRELDRRREEELRRSLAEYEARRKQAFMMHPAAKEESR